MDQELKTYLDGMESRVREHTEAVQTRLLREFWKWARTADARYLQNNAIVGALDARVQAIEDHFSDIERNRPQL